MRAGLGLAWGSFRLCKGLMSRMLLGRFKVDFESISTPSKPQTRPHYIRPQQAQQSPETSPEQL